MTHPVLSDPDFTAAITLRHSDGTSTRTTGQLVRNPEREDLAEAPGRLAIHAPTPANADRVSTIVAMNGQEYDVLESDPQASGLGSPAFAAWDSTMYVVRQRPILTGDWSLNGDWSANGDWIGVA